MNSTISDGQMRALQRRLRIARDVKAGRFRYIQCPLCSNEAAIGGRVGNTMNSVVSCNICGDFNVCYQAEVNLVQNRRLAPLGHILSGISRANHDRFESPRLLIWEYDTSGNSEVDYYHFGGGEPIELKASQKLDFLLAGIQSRCDLQVGVATAIVLPDDQSLGFAKSRDELIGLLSELENDGFVSIENRLDENDLSIASVALTVKGADKPLTELKVEEGIIMPEKIEIDGEQFEFFKWKELGEGGFSEVFRGESKKHGPVAVKRIRFRKSAQAKREIQIVRSLVGRELANVLPVYAAGLDRDSSHLYIVMALGTRSLKQAIEDEGPLVEEDALEITRQIANGLVEIQNTNDSFHHRDLKPGNVIEYNGKWHIADFGNCRFEEADTSANTMAEFKSPPYAAPEQWERDSTSIKTDVYALGCILHELLTKRPPFEGKQVRELHLTGAVPKCDMASVETKQMLDSMLSKDPAWRPKPADLLGEKAGDKSDVFSKLRASAAKLQKEKEASKIAQKSTVSDAAKVAAQVSDASNWLQNNVITPFLGQVESAFNGNGKRNGLSFEVPGKARLAFGRPEPLTANYESCGWDSIAESSIEVTRLDSKYSWGHSLVFGKHSGSSDAHAWHEIGFGVSALIPSSSYNRDMFHAYREPSIVSAAMGVGMAQWTVGFGPFDINSDLDQFFERWVNLLYRAVEGQLKSPSFFPPKGNWWK